MPLKIYLAQLFHDKKMSHSKKWFQHQKSSYASSKVLESSAFGKSCAFCKKCKYLSKCSNHFWFIPIMKLVLSALKKMSQEENFKKVTKIFLRLLNKKLRELKVMKIRSEVAKCFKGVGISKITHLIEPKSCHFLPRIQKILKL